jgi:hypothetical protein
LVATNGFDNGASREHYDLGFRVASIIPEPTSVVLTILAGGMLLTRRKR